MNYFLVLTKGGVIERQILWAPAASLEEVKEGLFNKSIRSDEENNDLERAREQIASDDDFELKIFEELEVISLDI